MSASAGAQDAPRQASEAGRQAPKPRLTVLGAGYLGITHAACMASLGFDVLALDTDSGRVDQLNAGKVPVYEPGLAELLIHGWNSGRLRFTTSYDDIAAFGDVHFLCVGTPQLAHSYRVDLSQVKSCVASLAPLLHRPCLVVGKSTVPVGTAARLSVELARLAPVGAGAELAWNPEFVREGQAVADSLRPQRIVVGVTSAAAEQTIRQVYASLIADGARFFATDLETAELAKAAANSFIATKISFINAMAELCEASGADLRMLADVLGADQRIGAASLCPGLGFGGGCLPKDIRALMEWAADLGIGEALGFLREVDAVNLRCRTRLVDLTCAMIGKDAIAGARVCVLGASFKPGSDDVRDSPALDVAQILHGMGAVVTVHDPVAIRSARRACPQLRYSRSVLSAAYGAEVVLVLTEWPEFVGLTPEYLDGAVAKANIIDGRNALDPVRWRTAGWNYQALGAMVRPLQPGALPLPR